jgi:hypothetical protein
MQPIDVACARLFKSTLGNDLEIFRQHPECMGFRQPQEKLSEAARERMALGMAAFSSLGRCTMAICLNGAPVTSTRVQWIRKPWKGRDVPGNPIEGLPSWQVQLS